MSAWTPLACNSCVHRLHASTGSRAAGLTIARYFPSPASRPRIRASICTIDVWTPVQLQVNWRGGTVAIPPDRNRTGGEVSAGSTLSLNAAWRLICFSPRPVSDSDIARQNRSILLDHLVGHGPPRGQYDDRQQRCPRSNRVKAKRAGDAHSPSKPHPCPRRQALHGAA